MSVTSYVRLRLFWGALDYEHTRSDAPAYTSAQTISGGPSAAAGSGVGVRRAQLTILRTLGGVAQDPAVMHFSFLNLTAGTPDDTWTTADYTNLETPLKAWMNAMSTYMAVGYNFSEIRWYREGTGVVPPNPPERVTAVTPLIPGIVTTSNQIAQVACSITFRTGSRRHWGRTYLPYSKVVDNTLRPSASDVDNIAGAANTLVTSAAASDMHLVVVADSINSSLNVESVEADNVLDVVRRRRLKAQTYRKILP